MNRQQLFSVVFFAVLVLLLYQIALMFRPFLLPFLWAMILAHMTFPVHERLTAALGGRESLSAACLTAGILALGVVPVVVLGILLVGEAGAAEQAVRAWIAAGGLLSLPGQIEQVPLVGGLLHKTVGGYLLQPGAMERLLVSTAKFVSQFFVEEVGSLLKNAFLLVTDFFIMLFALFFLFKDGKRWLAALYDVIPMDESHKEKIFTRLEVTVRAVVKGIVLTAIVQGLLAGAAYMVLAVPFPVVLTAVTVILAPFPFGGTALVWGPVVFYLFWMGMLAKALIMLVWGIGVVSTVDQVLRPWLIGQQVEIPVFFLVFSVLGGLALYGLIGLFVGPILMSLFLVAVQIYREEYQAQDGGPDGSVPTVP